MAKNVRRVLFTLLTVVLTAVLLWILWRFWDVHQVHIAVLSVDQYDLLAVPPIRFSREDADSLRELAEKLNTEARAGGIELLTDSKNIDLLNERLPTTPKGALILYVNAHGVSEDGEAWLLCNDYSLQEEKGRYELHKLLVQISEHEAKTKLLLLDTNHISSDPYTGMFVNEFAQLLAEKVKDVNDPTLWVISSCRPLETSHVCDTAKRSVFNYFLVKGLEGAADRNRDDTVDLDELFTFVHDHVADWVDRHSDPAESQKPMLFQGGKGEVDPEKMTEKVALAPVVARRKTSSTIPQTEASQGSKEAPAQGQTAGANAGKNQPLQAILDKLNEAWKLRDKIESRSDSKWSPVDYAPHLWRNHQEHLLAYQRLLLAGATFRTDLQDLLEKDIQAMQQLAREETSAVEAPLWKAIQCKNDLMFRAPYYVRSYAAMSRVSPAADATSLLNSLLRLLEQFQKLTDCLERLDSLTPDEDSLAQLRRITADLREADRAVFEDELEQKAKQLAKEAERDPAKRGLAGQIVALLDSPLLLAGRRDELLKAVVNPPQSLPEISDVSKNTRRSIARESCTPQLEQQAELEQKLVLLAGSAAHEIPLRDLRAISDDAAFWKACRDFGDQLGSFYRSLPEKFNKGIDARFSSDPAAATSHCDRLLRLIDARDADKVSEKVAKIVLPLPPLRSGTLQITPPKPAPLLFDAKNESQLKFAVVKEFLPEAEGYITLTYDSAMLEVHSANEKLQTPGTRTPVKLPQNETPRSYTVHAPHPGNAPTNIIVKVECGTLTATNSFSFQLPKPDEVKLVVCRMVAKVEGDLIGDWLRCDKISSDDMLLQPDKLTPHPLHPFPNRTTSYHFELSNQSGRKKNFVAQLFALPELFRDKPQDRQSLDALLKRRDTKKIAEAVVELPETEQAQRILFSAPKAPVPEKGAAKAAGPEGTPPKPDITHGLALVLLDEKADKQPKWMQCFRFSPTKPRRYVEEPKVDYNYQKGQIDISVRAAVSADVSADVSAELPPPSEPIHVTLDAKLLPDDASGKKADTFNSDGRKKAELTTAKPEALLYIKADESLQGKKVRVELAVDDYPRAFVFAVKCNQLPDNGQLQRNLTEVQITEPTKGQAFDPEKPVMVKFRVDAPWDAFLESNASDRDGLSARDAVQLEIFDEHNPSAENPKKTFFADRQVKIHLDEISPAGELKVRAMVGDFEVKLDRLQWENVKARIAVHLRLTNGVAVDKEVPILLDGKPPEFTVSVPPEEVIQGDDVNVVVDAAKMYEKQVCCKIKKIELGFEGNQPGQFKGEPEVIEAGPENTWTHPLSTKDFMPRKYTILVRVTNEVDKKSEKETSVWVRKPATPPPNPGNASPPNTGTIEGVVLLGSQTMPHFAVELQGIDRTKTDGNGRYRFENVPPGTYTIKVVEKGWSATEKVTLHDGEETAIAPPLSVR